MSTKEQRDGRTIESQKQALHTEAKRRGTTASRNYEDDGTSGAKLSRPGLDQLRDDAALGKFDLLLVHSVDRLSRDTANLAVILRDLKRRGVKVVFLNIPEADGPTGKLLITMLGMFAEFERGLIADRMRRGRRFKVETRGLVAGTEAPYGYDYIKQDKEKGIVGRYVVNEAEARVVKLIFRWAIDERLSTIKIARRLNRRGIRPRRAPTWRHSTVARILADETCTGTTYYNKLGTREEQVKGRWVKRRRKNDRSKWIAIKLQEELQLVSRADFKRAREIIDSRNTHPQRRKYSYLLRHVKRSCGGCSRALSGVSSHGVRRYYVCGTVREGGTCQHKTIRAERAEVPLWRAVRRILLEPEFIQQLIVAERQRNDGSGPDGDGPRKTSLEKERKQSERERKRLLAAYQKGFLELGDFEREYKRLGAQLKELDRRAAVLVTAKPTRREIGDDVEAWAGRLRGRLDGMQPYERELLLADVIREVVIDGNVMRVRGCVPARRTASMELSDHGSESAPETSHAFEFAIPLLKGVPRRTAA